MEEDENLFLGEIGTETNNTFWSVDLMLNNAQVRFKIDTGDDLTVIPDKIYEALRPTPTLVKSIKTLFGPAHTSLHVRGCFVGKIQKGDKTTEQEIFVVNGARNALLGRPAIETLAIVQKVDAVEATNLKQSFQDFSLDLEKFEVLTMS